MVGRENGAATNKIFWMCKTVLILFLTNYRTPSPLILDQNYINTKNQVIKAERRVLKELGFCVHVKHPHKVSCRIKTFIFRVRIEFVYVGVFMSFKKPSLEICQLILESKIKVESLTFNYKTVDNF